MDEDELLNREGLSPQEYLEFTERESLPANRSEVGKTYSLCLHSRYPAKFFDVSNYCIVLLFCFEWGTARHGKAQCRAAGL